VASAHGPLLVVAAWAPELRGLGRLAKGGAAPARAVVGVGLIEAAAGTARLIERQRPRAVVLIGTAGVYPGADVDDVALGSAVLVRTMHLASASVARGNAYLPEPLPATATVNSALLDELAAATALPICDVACPLAITRAATVAQQLRKATGAALENLEAFAVARAAASVDVPFAAVLGIANRVGPEGHAEWRAHGEKAAAAACAAVRTWVAASR
jgi:nucleoside phosphorylase